MAASRRKAVWGNGRGCTMARSASTVLAGAQASGPRRGCGDGYMPSGKLAILPLLWLAVPAGVFLLAWSGSPASTHVIVELKGKAGEATYSRWLRYTRLIEADFGNPIGAPWGDTPGNNCLLWGPVAAPRSNFPSTAPEAFHSAAFFR